MVHGENQYNYANIDYINSYTKINIVCLIHGVFEKLPNNHTRGSGCPECTVRGRPVIHVEDFIKDANILHNYKYDYKKVSYVNGDTKVIIICPEHGEFTQTLKLHRRGAGCLRCRVDNSIKTTKQFIIDAVAKHGLRYNYTNTIYVNAKTKVNIVCPSHGMFKHLPAAHTVAGFGCRKCNIDKLRKSIVVPALIKAKKLYNNKYSYSKLKYIRADERVTITCPKHGDFEQLLNTHTRGHGCKKCYYESINLTTAEFKSRAIAIHGDTYGYTKVVYKDFGTYVNIYCKKHDRYYLQKPRSHLSGSGCPRCRTSRGEFKVAEYLDSLGINYVQEYSFPNSLYRYDFYLPTLNILIEYDGKQHYIPVTVWGGSARLKIYQARDKNKNELASINKKSLIRIPYTQYNVLEDYLLFKLSRIYRYCVDGIYYKSYSTLCKGMKLPKATRVVDVKKFRVYPGVRPCN